MTDSNTSKKDGRLSLFVSKEARWNLKLEAMKAKMTTSKFVEKLLTDYMNSKR